MFERTAQAKSEPAKTTSGELLSRQCEEPSSSAADLLWYTAQSLQVCLLEQDRLSAKLPDFLHKGLVTNCARASLMLFDQLLRCLNHQQRASQNLRDRRSIAPSSIL